MSDTLIGGAPRGGKASALELAALAAKIKAGTATREEMDRACELSYALDTRLQSIIQALSRR